MPIHVVFEVTADASKLETSEKYYETLSPHLRKQPGFIEELNYVNDDPNSSLAMSSWVSEEALLARQILPAHLRIEKAARENVFESYRVRLGWEEQAPEPKARTGKKGRRMVLHQQPRSIRPALATRSCCNDDEIGAASVQDMWREDADASSVLQELVDHRIWWNDTHTLHVTSWLDAARAEAFAADVERVPGDWLRRVAVDREYTRVDRKEVPQNTEPDIGHL